MRRDAAPWAFRERPLGVITGERRKHSAVALATIEDRRELGMGSNA
jgi:hypothetical protein